MEKLTRDQYRERAAAKVAAAQEVLAAEVAALVTGADWQEFLDFQATLHDYSANNVMLIFAQHARAYEEGRVPEPTPTYIAAFETSRGRAGGEGQAFVSPRQDRRCCESSPWRPSSTPVRRRGRTCPIHPGLASSLARRH